MDISNDFNKLSFKPVVFKLNYFNSYRNFSISVPKIAKINL